MGSKALPLNFHIKCLFEREHRTALGTAKPDSKFCRAVKMLRMDTSAVRADAFPFLIHRVLIEGRRGFRSLLLSPSANPSQRLLIGDRISHGAGRIVQRDVTIRALFFGVVIALHHELAIVWNEIVVSRTSERAEVKRAVLDGDNFESLHLCFLLPANQAGFDLTQDQHSKWNKTCQVNNHENLTTATLN
ncbi:MAG TPA: hypothetical protein VFA85_13960 [Terriglobales bacterium]|nr:hypothetical protein [Terriglobales bacterium]